MSLDLLGPTEYMIGLWVISAILLGLGSIAYQSNVRVGGAFAWVMFLLFGSLGGFLALPLTTLMGLDGYLFILMLCGFVCSLPIIHWLIPAIASDFQTTDMSASLVLAFLVGIAVCAAAFVVLDWRDIAPIHLLGGMEPFPTE